MPLAYPRLSPEGVGGATGWQGLCSHLNLLPGASTTMVLVPGALEVCGAAVSGGAWLCSLASTFRSWLTSSTQLLPAETYQLGLWGVCVVQEPGALQCRAFGGVLGLPLDLSLGRILMVLVLGVGLCSFLMALASTPLLHRRHRALRPAGVLLSLAAGTLVMVPVSRVAHVAVRRYHDPSVPEVAPRWELGDALFFGWTAGALHLLAGALLLTSCWFPHTGTSTEMSTGTSTGTLGRPQGSETA